MGELQMKDAARRNAIQSVLFGEKGDHELEGFYFRQAWALCPVVTLTVRRNRVKQ